MLNKESIILENEKFRLTLLSDGTAQSLILKSNNMECLIEEKLPFFCLTENRPYHNEIKLSQPTVKTVFPANHVRMENGMLIVGFDKLYFEAVVNVEITNRYMIFSLVDFIVKPDSFGIGVAPIDPPVLQFRLVQLPVSNKENFGNWLNVMWDAHVAINVLSASPYSTVGAEKRTNHQILFGQSLSEVKLKNAGVALIVSEPEQLLCAIKELEIDKNLPLGATNRKSKELNRSYYWVSTINPDNVDEHIRYAKKAGLKYILIYYSAILYDAGRYSNTGIYHIYRDEYKNGEEDLICMLNKIKAAGLIPGLHILHSHIGMKTPYLTPVADHRLNLTRHFTLAKPLSPDDTTIFVEENPDNCPRLEKMRILKFMGELIQYTSFTTQRPYAFTGCKRGYNDTFVRSHETGTIGGILDVTEFGGNSAYIDQNTTLQDEVAEEITKLYNAGFELLYFDGSEGVSPPFDVNVGLAQWRVYDKLAKKPIFCEGAAKSHFSWHMLNGGNAFDVWKPENFKQMIAVHPFQEAARMANDFTRINFGWWKPAEGQRPDIIEYGTALAAAWDCPGSIIGNLDNFNGLARIDDILETLRRWEDARTCGFITPEIKSRLRQTHKEHTLLINEEGKYELAEWVHIKTAVNGNTRITVFLFQRNGKTYAACWDNQGSCHLSLAINKENIQYVDDIGGDEVSVEIKESQIIIPVDKKRYLISDIPKDKFIKYLEAAKIL